MYIVHVAEYLDLSFGGPSICVPSIAAAQAKKGHDLKVLCYEPEDVTGYFEFLKLNVPNYSNIEFIFIPRPNRFGSYFLNKNTIKILLSVIGAANVLHVHGVWKPLLLKSLQIAKKANVKRIVTPHGMLDPWSLSQKKIRKTLALLLGWKEGLNNCTYIHALNKSERDLMKSLKLKSPVKIVSNGVFRENFYSLPPKGSFHKKHKDLNGRPFILFLSRLHYKKGLDYLIESYSIFSKANNSVDLVIAGPDGGELEKLRSNIAMHKLNNRVHIVGPLYNDDKFSALVDASCFCLPSRQEGFSIAITEALACGTPVVISENCNFPEVSDNNCGFVVPLKSELIADALNKILSSDALLDKMSESSQRLVFTSYIWDVVANSLVDGYNGYS